MTYRVLIEPAAKEELRQAYRFIRRDSPVAASRWIKEARKRINTLTKFLERCNLAPENESFPEPVRELFYGSGNRGTYRILFVVRERTVYVLHVRHGSMDQLRPFHLN
jgi:plasmid stabilization system protein ParE